MKQPVLKQFINLWTLTHYPNGRVADEWSIDEKLSAIKNAGFDGFQMHAHPELASISRAHGLTYLGACDADGTNYRQRLETFARLKPIFVNVQLCNHDTPPSEAVRVWIDLNQAADDLGLLVDLEIHRDTCTETPEKAWQIAELYEQRSGRAIRFNFDLSHFAVVKHLVPPYAGRLLDHPTLFRLSRQMHLRPFNGHHCQIPVTDGQGRLAEVAKPWLDFVAAAFACWLDGRRDEETLWVCPELGSLTSGYWLPSYPDPWQDAVYAQKEFEGIWRDAVAQRAA